MSKKPGTLGIEFGWLVEYANEHTCAGGTPESGGMHELGCGMLPIVPVEGKSKREVVAWIIDPFFAHNKHDDAWVKAAEILRVLGVEDSGY